MTGSSRLAGFAAIALLLGAMFVSTPTGSTAVSVPTVSCGQVLTEDTTLTRDLVGCVGDGLIIGAPGVTLNLNGHSLGGMGVGAGVFVSGSAEQAIITNGSVFGFDQGIRAWDGIPTFRLTSMQVFGNRIGVFTGFCTSCGQLTIESSRIERNMEHGVWTNDHPLTVIDSAVRRNGGIGIWANETLPGRFQRNDISNNGGIGLYLDDSTGTMIDNRFNRNGGAGFRLEVVHPDPLDSSFVRDNQANGNGGLGFSIFSISPWEGFDGGGNIAKGNGDTRECAVETAFGLPPIPPGALVCSRNKGDF